MGNAFLVILYLTANGKVYGNASVGPFSMSACRTLAVEMTKQEVVDELGYTKTFACLKRKPTAKGVE
jgi:hypothetical protein